MKLAHHGTELLTCAKVTQGVIVVVHDGCDPGHESVEFRVMVEAVPENQLCFVGIKSRKLIATARGDEVDAVVAVPMLEAMLSVIKLVRGIGAFSEVHARKVILSQWNVKQKIAEARGVVTLVTMSWATKDAPHGH